MPDINHKLIVVIRTVGERTFSACKDLVIEQVPESCVHVVSEQPFEATLRRCYQIGIESSAEWMMTLDADVLLREKAVEDFLAEAESLPSQYLQLEGLILDKLTGLYRKAGHRMYRTKHLKTALDCIPPKGTEIRPEYATLTKMASLGFPSMEIQTVFGIHDYEQYYVDIYRKAFIHANKHPQWVSHFITRWKEGSLNDADYLIALRGLYDGLMSTTETRIDHRDYIEGASQALKELNIHEKSDLSPDYANFSYVKSVLDQAEPSLPISTMTRMQRLKNYYQRLGPFRLFPYLLGALLSKIGKKLKNSVSTV